MEFNQKFDRAPILALQDGKFDNIFLLSLSSWLVDLGPSLGLKPTRGYKNVSLQLLKTTGRKTLQQMRKLIRETICPIIQNKKGGPRSKAHLH